MLLSWYTDELCMCALSTKRPSIQLEGGALEEKNYVSKFDGEKNVCLWY